MKLRLPAIAALAAVLILAGCASKPEPLPEPEPEPVVVEPVPEPVSTITRESLEELHARVLALRNDAFDSGAKDSLPDDWAAADARYLAGKSALDADSRETAQSELQAALPLFQSLSDRTAQAGADKGKLDAAAARERAVSSEADRFSPESLGAADAYLAAAEAAYASGDHRAARTAYAKAAAAYDAAEKRSRAAAVKARVDLLGFGPMDAGNYELAGRKFVAVDATIGTDPVAAGDAAAESLLRYNLVLAKGWELSAGGRRDEAARYKTDSEGIKAQVAVKADYDAAKAVWDEAAYEYAAGRHENAAALFAKAEEMFKAVYETAAAKRAAALKAIEDANARTEQSAGTAAAGDATLATEGNP